ncbi:hypothetical protein JCM33374_g3770 [Metschnikowia sp. JCM 33374]|nr:hypothetical protein JCM33374_g3770 [Metschnikowia sp. JCM 33374]
MDPPSLNEILGVTPFFHLVPTQDLAPLVTFSRVHPKALEPKDFLPRKAKDLFSVVDNEHSNHSDGAVEEFMGRVETKFRDFDDTELHSLKFKRPVIAGDTETPPKLPEVSKMFNGLLKNSECVEEINLADFGNNLDFSDMACDQLHLLDGTEDNQQLLHHMNFYKRKFDAELCGPIPHRKRGPPQDSSIARMTRRRITLDRSKLKDSRLVALYDFLDQNILDDGLDMPNSSESPSTMALTYPDSKSMV